MGIDINRLGPAAQKQVAEALEQRRQLRVAPPPTPEPLLITRADCDSDLEYNYYLANILPLVRNGEVVNVELHREFLLFEPMHYSGMKFKKAVYKPDFVLTHKAGTIEVLEVKSKFVRKKQRDYPLRRRLFVEKWAMPNGWIFREEIY